MNAPILVTGGTGTIGSRAVRLLRQEGRDVRVLSRHPRPDVPGVKYMAGDTLKGLGLEPALNGVDTVLHLAGGAKGDDLAAQQLVAAAELSGISHLVLISVIGADLMPIGYFRDKAAAERIISDSGVPSTVLRVAQLHNLVFPIVRGLARMPLTPIPGGLRFEPVGLDAVAARLVELVLAEPAGRVADLAGPEILDVAQLLAGYTAARHGHRQPRFPVHIPGSVGRAYRTGKNLSGSAAQHGQHRWADFLAGQHEEPARL